MRALPPSLLCLLVCLLLACGAEPGADEPPAPRPAAPETVTSTVPAPAPAVPTTTAPPTALETPEDARRFLEERGVDPAELSREAAEQMRRRLRPAARE